MNLIDIQHPRETLLSLEILLVSKTGGFDASLLSSLVSSLVLSLLALIVLSEEGSLFLTVGTLDVVETFGDDTHLLVEFAFLLLELLDLESHNVISAEVLHFLKREC